MQEDQDNSITKPDIIAAHLGRLQRERQLVKINIIGTNDTFNSLLVSVNPAKQSMLLDVLHPDTAHQQLIKNKKFIFNVDDDGVKISFKGVIKKVVKDNGKPAYFVAFPNKLIYQQRRQSFRAPISKDTLLAISLTDVKSNQSCTGIINNVSRDGLCLQFNYDENFDFKQFHFLSSQFITTTGEKMTCDVEVRNVIPDSVYRHTKVGVRFRNLDQQQRRHIQSFSLQMERQMMKRKRS